ncbi:hypothetical protein ACFFWE_37235 [Sphaerisporangium melleum]|uniref:hypothetical protein n=1 Tax=Sphaerisporangium melleum TaxID=321316 RepID=UPI0016660ABF|nr:hypothetical protein [Sphaerisporangium melleum]
MSDHTPIPLAFDTTFLSEVVRGYPDLINIVRRFDAEKQPMVIPALAIVGASLDSRSSEAADALYGMALLESVEIAPLAGPKQGIALAEVIARTDLEPWDAHVAAVAIAAICPILTLKAARWEEPARSLGEPLYICEIADPTG